MKITKDNFVWKNVTTKAHEIYKSNLFELYAVYPNESETLIRNQCEINKAIKKGAIICIEVGKIK